MSPSVLTDACVVPRLLDSFPTRRSSDLSSSPTSSVWPSTFTLAMPCDVEMAVATCRSSSADFGLMVALPVRSEEHTSELQSQSNLVCRPLLEKKNRPASIPVHHALPHPT